MAIKNSNILTIVTITVVIICININMATHANNIDDPLTSNITNAQQLFKAQENLHKNLVQNTKKFNIQSNIHSKQYFKKHHIGNIKKSYLSNMTTKIRQNEATIRKSLLGKASTLDLVKSANETKQTVNTAVMIRDELFKTIDKVFNMPL